MRQYEGEIKHFQRGSEPSVTNVVDLDDSGVLLSSKVIPYILLLSTLHYCVKSWFYALNSDESKKN